MKRLQALCSLTHSPRRRWNMPSEPKLRFLSEFPTPILSAATSPVVPWNGSVRIICQGTPEAFLYQLYLVKNSTPTVIEEKLGFQKEAEFIIKYMNTTTAGYYQCRYRKKYHWSEQSKPLELVVTGKEIALGAWPSASYFVFV